ncbi:MAG TPA: twin-arginine translocase TatA/TatE family subunit [Anaerolineae bacterium]|nr:twin-arginine translocase TatA/TatE family subunit [Anaerolineae bacterium]
MDILGVGFPELMFILIIALMVFGPRRLPEIAGKLGRYVAQLRSLSDGLMAEWQREINAATQLEELEQARKDIQEIKEDFKKTGSELSQARKDIDKEAKSIAPPTQPRSPQPKSSAPTTADPKPEEPSQPADATPPVEAETTTETSDVAHTQSRQKPDDTTPKTPGDAQTKSPQLPPSTNGSTSHISPESQEVLGD